jgi:cyclic-di-GMP-binding protein
VAKSFSFDVVCRLDLAEVRNAVNLAQKEIATRYDFKNSTAKVTLDDDGLTLQAENDSRLRAVVEMLEEKLARRSVPLKGLDYGRIEAALGGTVRQKVGLANGIPDEKAREMNKMLRRDFKKVSVAIQGDTLRITSSSKDDLQAAMTALREGDWGLPLQFTNYR